MSLCYEGLDKKLQDVSFTVKVSTSELILQVANLINWQHVATIAESDLKKTTKGFWWIGRKINLRTHLSVMILQTLCKSTDRNIERQISISPVYQVFCGKSLLSKWKCPDHSKVEEFRNRLSPCTHKKIAEYVLGLAVHKGFADASRVDIDSTVQEAKMAYPSDACLMRKLAQKCSKVLNFLREKTKLLPHKLSIDIKMLEKKAKEYFFLVKNTAIEKKRQVFKTFHSLVTEQTTPIIDLCERLKQQKPSLPWNIRRSVEQIACHARKYLRDVAYFIKNHTLKKGKILSFHCFMVACIKKGKVGKEKEFGRIYQLGRIGGNFIVPYDNNSIRMEDKKSLIAIVEEHEKIFGKGVLKNIATDKGYYSNQNIKSIAKKDIATCGIQRPRSIKNQSKSENTILLHHRRAGIEPLIGHVKNFGLRKSKMKSDKASLSQGYRSVLGFNLHQLTRHLAKIA